MFESAYFVILKGATFSIIEWIFIYLPPRFWAEEELTKSYSTFTKLLPLFRDERSYIICLSTRTCGMLRFYLYFAEAYISVRLFSKVVFFFLLIFFFLFSINYHTTLTATKSNRANAENSVYNDTGSREERTLLREQHMLYSEELKLFLSR